MRLPKRMNFRKRSKRLFWGQNWNFLWRVLVELSVFLLISPMGNGHHLLRGFIMFRSLLFYFLLSSHFFYFFLEYFPFFYFWLIVANVRLEKWGGGIWFGVEFVYSAMHCLQHSIREAFKPNQIIHFWGTWNVFIACWWLFIQTSQSCLAVRFPDFYPPPHLPYFLAWRPLIVMVNLDPWPTRAHTWKRLKFIDTLQQMVELQYFNTLSNTVNMLKEWLRMGRSIKSPF